MMQTEDALGIAAEGSSSRDGHHAELLRLTAELVGSSGPAASTSRRDLPGRPTHRVVPGSYFADLKSDPPLRLPATTLVLPRHGVARELSLPERRR